MTNYQNTVLFGDCRASLRQIASDGVKAQMCVTSPPYYGLRDYGHEGQLGLEATPEQYITNMIEVFRCVRDVLADDGTLWVNIGDSYAGSWGNYGGENRGKGGGQRSITKGSSAPNTAYDGLEKSRPAASRKMEGIKSKDLIGIPWMLAFALRADGWYLRQDIIWHKPNPMPESVTDRCTKSHEYIFLFSRQSTYYYDHQSIAEPSLEPSKVRAARGGSFVNGRSDGAPYAMKHSPVAHEMRNKRSVWTVATKSYSGAHFATYPPKLIEPCILAGSRIGDTVLDPFFGSGTTGEVALNLGRHYIGCEINAAYEPLQIERTRQNGLVFA